MGHEGDEIRHYVELESEEEVTHLEKVKTEWIYGHKHEGWDVWTENDRYWVITPSTNLYSQREFQSLDYTLSFHIGLVQRVAARYRQSLPEDQDHLAAAWRQSSEALDALHQASEAAEFQAVGVRCRQSLITLVNSLSDEGMVPDGDQKPKGADFVHWSELIANNIAPGDRSAEVRGHLKALAKSAWQLVGWLTHNSNATSLDAAIVVEATQNTIGTFVLGLRRHQNGSPGRCPRCGSYRVVKAYRPDLYPHSPTADFCEKCGLGGEVADSVRKDLFELTHVRNVLVHRSGVADRRIATSCPWLALKPGDKVAVGKERYERYFRAASEYLSTVILRLHTIFGEKGLLVPLPR